MIYVNYFSSYHNTWHVADSPGNYNYNYTMRCSEDILELSYGVVSVKDEYYGKVYVTYKDLL